MKTADSQARVRLGSCRRTLFPILLIAWLGFIFGTSCTVIRPQEFFALVQEYAIVDEASMQRFKVFWGLSWFAIVKGWHFIEFAVLLLLCVAALKWWRGITTPLSIGGAMLFCIAFAISDEWHQSLVPDRFGTLTDVVIDSLGVSAAGVALLWRSRQN